MNSSRTQWLRQQTKHCYAVLCAHENFAVHNSWCNELVSGTKVVAVVRCLIAVIEFVHVGSVIGMQCGPTILYCPDDSIACAVRGYAWAGSRIAERIIGLS